MIACGEQCMTGGYVGFSICCVLGGAAQIGLTGFEQGVAFREIGSGLFLQRLTFGYFAGTGFLQCLTGGDERLSLRLKRVAFGYIGVAGVDEVGSISYQCVTSGADGIAFGDKRLALCHQ